MGKIRYRTAQRVSLADRQDGYRQEWFLISAVEIVDCCWCEYTACCAIRGKAHAGPVEVGQIDECNLYAIEKTEGSLLHARHRGDSS